MTTKKGWTLEYGTTPDAQIKAVGKEDVRVWALNKITDLNGNYLTVTYTQSPISSVSSANGQYYPSRIDYTGKADSGLDFWTPHLADVTGDGRTDLILISQKEGVYVMLSNGRGFDVDKPWYSKEPPLNNMTFRSPSFADVTGDGKTDLILISKDGTYVVPSNGQGFDVDKRWFGKDGLLKDLNFWSRSFADVTGDGKTDLILISKDGTYVVPSNGQGFDVDKRWFGKDGLLKDLNFWSRSFADVTGDGKTDLILISKDGTYVVPSNGQGFDVDKRWYSHEKSPLTDMNSWLPSFADVTGDGKTDLILFSKHDGVYVMPSNGQGFDVDKPWFSKKWPLTDRNFWSPSFADVTGDGRIDAILLNKTEGVYVVPSNGRGFDVDERWYSHEKSPLAAFEPQRSIRLSYESRTDVPPKYQGGSIIKTAARLSKIQTYVGDTLVKEYRLAYAYSGLTGRSLLTSITECAADGVCLPPTTFDWQDSGTSGFDKNGHVTLPPNPDGVIGPGNTFFSLANLPADVNGDGKTDLVRVTRYGRDQKVGLTTFLSTGKGFESGKPTRTLQGRSNLGFFPMDVNGDGKTDVVQPWENYSDSSLMLMFYPSTGDGFGPAHTEKAGGSGHLALLPGDVNGDGKSDLIQVWDNKGTIGLISYLSNGSGSEILENHTDTSQPTSNLGFFPMDVNGDGKTDVVQPWKDGVNLKLTVYFSAGKKFNQPKTFDGGAEVRSATLTYPLLPGDVNGDGKSDLILIWNRKGSIGLIPILSNGSGFEILENHTDTSQPTSNSGFFAMDVNGDGKTDVVQIGKDHVNVITYFSNGFKFDEGHRLTYPKTSHRSENQFFPADVNGDGKSDLLEVFAYTSREGFFSVKTFGMETYVSLSPYPDLLTTITNGLGGQVEITYKPLTDDAIYTRAVNTPKAPHVEVQGLFNTSLPIPQYPIKDIQDAMYVVSDYVKKDGRGNAYAYSYQYAGAMFDLERRLWLGFDMVTKTDAQLGVQRITTYNQTFPLNGTVAGMIRKCAPKSGNKIADPKFKPGAILGSTTYTYVTPPPSQHKNVYQVQRKSRRKDYYSYGAYQYSLGEAYAFDEYGNLKSLTDLGYVSRNGQDKSSNDNLYTYRNYANDASNWRLGYLTNEKVTKASSLSNIQGWDAKNDLSLEQLQYDGNMNISARQRWDDTNSVWLTTTYAYDGYGNRTAVIGPAGATTSTPNDDYAYQTEYETTYHTFPQKRLSPVNEQKTRLTTTYIYDPRFGALTSKTDPNGNKTRPNPRRIWSGC